MEQENIQQNRTDLLVSTIKSIVGITPFFGQLLSELVGTLIPNQRIDRLSKFCEELNRMLSKFEKEFLEEKIKNEECRDLFEEGFIQASRSLSDDRRKYISSIIANGLSDENITYAESKHLMRLLQELNDIEIIWLRSYLVSTINGDKEFRELHKNVLQQIRPRLGTNQNLLTKSALQKSYKEHLERLGLVQPHYNTDRETGLPEFDKFSGKPKSSFCDASPLGKLLLNHIGLSKEESQ